MGNATGDGPAGSAWDFFISYAVTDQSWAEWIAWQLEDAGYRVQIQAWDFRAGMHFVAKMHRAAQGAARTVVVLSAAYLKSAYAEAEWQAAWADDPTGEDQKLLVFRIEDCRPPGLLGQVIFVDLFDVDRGTACDRLLAAARENVRGKPPVPPDFPGRVEPGFPGDPFRDRVMQAWRMVHPCLRRWNSAIGSRRWADCCAQCVAAEGF